jgi:hypothetical protein
MQAILMETPDPGIRAYFVWGPFLDTDSEKTAREITERVWSPNSVYFWTPDKKLAMEAGWVLQLAAGRPAWDVYLLFKRGIMWEKTFPIPTYWQQQLDVLQGDKYDPQQMRVKIHESLRER